MIAPGEPLPGSRQYPSEPVSSTDYFSSFKVELKEEPSGRRGSHGKKKLGKTGLTWRLQTLREAGRCYLQQSKALLFPVTRTQTRFFLITCSHPTRRRTGSPGAFRCVLLTSRFLLPKEESSSPSTANAVPSGVFFVLPYVRPIKNDSSFLFTGQS